MTGHYLKFSFSIFFFAAFLFDRDCRYVFRFFYPGPADRAVRLLFKRVERTRHCLCSFRKKMNREMTLSYGGFHIVVPADPELLKALLRGIVAGNMPAAAAPRQTEDDNDGTATDASGNNIVKKSRQ